MRYLVIAGLALATSPAFAEDAGVRALCTVHATAQANRPGVYRACAADATAAETATIIMREQFPEAIPAIDRCVSAWTYHGYTDWREIAGCLSGG